LAEISDNSGILFGSAFVNQQSNPEQARPFLSRATSNLAFKHLDSCDRAF